MRERHVSSKSPLTQFFQLACQLTAPQLARGGALKPQATAGQAMLTFGEVRRASHEANRRPWIRKSPAPSANLLIQQVHPRANLEPYLSIAV